MASEAFVLDDERVPLIQERPAGILREGYLLGNARLTNTRSLALIGDPSAQAYELLFSFSGPENKARFLEMVRSNDNLGDDKVETDLLRPILDEIRETRPIAKILPRYVLVRGTLVAATICDATSSNNIH